MIFRFYLCFDSTMRARVGGGDEYGPKQRDNENRPKDDENPTPVLGMMKAGGFEMHLRLEPPWYIFNNGYLSVLFYLVSLFRSFCN